MAQPSKSLDLERSSSQYFTTPDNTNLHSDFSIAWWSYFETDPDAGANMILLDKWNSTGNNKELRFLFHNNATFYAQTSSNGSTTNSKNVAYGDITTSTWYHYVLTYDISAGAVTLYRALESGSHTADVTITGAETSINNGTELFNWFADAGGSNAYDGLVHDFQIWDSVLTTGEMDTNFDDPDLSDSASGLLMRLRFEDDLTDSSPSGDDATGINSPTYSSTIPTYSGGGGGGDTFTPYVISY